MHHQVGGDHRAGADQGDRRAPAARACRDSQKSRRKSQSSARRRRPWRPAPPSRSGDPAVWISKINAAARIGEPSPTASASGKPTNATFGSLTMASRLTRPAMTGMPAWNSGRCSAQTSSGGRPRVRRASTSSKRAIDGRSVPSARILLATRYCAAWADSGAYFGNSPGGRRLVADQQDDDLAFRDRFELEIGDLDRRMAIVPAQIDHARRSKKIAEIDLRRRFAAAQQPRGRVDVCAGVAEDLDRAHAPGEGRVRRQHRCRLTRPSVPRKPSVRPPSRWMLMSGVISGERSMISRGMGTPLVLPRHPHSASGTRASATRDATVRRWWVVIGFGSAT